MLLQELLKLNEKKWSADVHEKVHAPEGLFAEGSAKKIADWAWKAHKKDGAKAMDALNFFLNRAGKKLDKEIKAKVESAKEIISSRITNESLLESSEKDKKMHA